jgi:hypothetical protein
MISMVDGAYCGSYSSSAEKNRLAFPLNDGYSHERGENYFGAPVVCDSLAPKVYYVPGDGGKNGTTKEEVEQQAFGVALGLGVLPTACRIAATRFLCASAFRGCEMFAISESLPNFLGTTFPSHFFASSIFLICFTFISIHVSSASSSTSAPSPISNSPFSFSILI